MVSREKYNKESGAGDQAETGRDTIQGPDTG